MADKETSEETSVVKIPTSKKHQVLLDINQQLKGLEINDSFRVAGKDFRISTLNADEEVWADSYTNLSSPVSATSSMRLSRLSAAIKAIDGIPISELFQFSDDVSENDKKYHTDSKYRLRYWEMNQMLLWLGELPGKYISTLWDSYVSLINRRDAVWDTIKKESAGTTTTGGKSSPSSSHEKESSQATQASSV